MMKKLCVLLLVALAFTSCEKEEGEGGNSVIKGKVKVREYTAFPILYTEREASDEDIYIIYGDDDDTFDDRTRTSFDGSYKFEFLTKGNYRVFVYSEDTNLTTFGEKIPIILEAKISKNKSEVSLDDITIIKLN